MRNKYRYLTGIAIGAAAFSLALLCAYLVGEEIIGIQAQRPSPVAPSARESSMPSSCTAQRPCWLEMGETIVLPRETALCMEPETWAHARKYRLVVSYNGGPERPYPCTNVARLGGKCTTRADRFRFLHQPGPVMYWFVGKDAAEC